MASVIIFETDTDEGCGVMYPSPESGLSVDDTARKDVPCGKRYIIVDEQDLPERKYLSAVQVEFNEEDSRGYGPEVWANMQEAFRMGLTHSFEFGDETDVPVPPEVQAIIDAEGGDDE